MYISYQKYSSLLSTSMSAMNSQQLFSVMYPKTQKRILKNNATLYLQTKRST